MNYQEALDWIHGRVAFGSRPGLIRIETLLKKLGSPEKKIKTVHIGGTNGKGSTLSMVRDYLIREGFHVGSFTSPYLVTFNERISLNGVPIADDDLTDLVHRICPIVEEMDQEASVMHMTEFEIITAMMFLYFYEQQVDVALVEVGLGGLLDCTNVIHPLVSVITTIGLDHMDILGDSIEKIAYQKAGIIKYETPVVLGNLPVDATRVIRSVATKQHSQVFEFGQDFNVSVFQKATDNGGKFHYKNESFDFEVALEGNHQLENAAVAIMTCQLVMPQLAHSFSMEKMQASLRAVRWPGRLEKIIDHPPIYLDGAHNEPAVMRLKEVLTQQWQDKHVTILFAAIATKDIQHMMALFQTIPNVTLKVTTFDYPRAVKKVGYVEAGLREEQWVSSWQTFISSYTSSEDDYLLVTGSLYFISQVREFILEEAYNWKK